MLISGWFCIALCSIPNRKHLKKVMGQILVAGKHSNLGVRESGEKQSWGKSRSSGPGGNHPGLER